MRSIRHVEIEGPERLMDRAEARVEHRVTQIPLRMRKGRMFQ